MNKLITKGGMGCTGLPVPITNMDGNMLLSLIFKLEMIAIAIMIMEFLLVVMKTVGKCLVLHKAGEKWWKGLIPFYSDYVFFKMFKLESVFCIFLVSSILFLFTKSGTIACFVLEAIFRCCLYTYYYGISVATGHKVPMFLGLALCSPIFWLALGLNNDDFDLSRVPMKEEEIIVEEKPKRLCPKCGVEVEDDALFCRKCGQDLNKKPKAKKKEKSKKKTEKKV